jgi:hypothetical protein
VELLPERNCSTCTPQNKINWGCEGNARQKLTLGATKLEVCPRRPLLDDPDKYSNIFWLYRQYKEGYLPETGGLYNQPAKYLEYIRIIDRALDFCRDMQQERDQRKKGASGRRP